MRSFWCIFFRVFIGSFCLAPTTALPCAAVLSKLAEKRSLQRFDTSFQIRNAASEEIKEKIIEWTLSKLPKDLRDLVVEDFVSLENGSKKWSKNGWGIELIAAQDIKSSTSRDLFALRFERPDDKRPEARTWITHIGLVTREGQDPEFNLELFVDDSANEFLTPPAFSTPQIVTQLQREFDARSSELPIKDHAISLSHQKIKKFVDSLRDPNRRLPVIYVTRNAENQILIDADQLAYQLRGRAIVVFEEANDGSSFSITNALTNYIPKNLLASGGAIRIYLPELNPEDPRGHLVHPLLDSNVLDQLEPSERLKRVYQIMDRRKTETTASQAHLIIRDITQIIQGNKTQLINPKRNPAQKPQKLNETLSLIEGSHEELLTLREKERSLQQRIEELVAEKENLGERLADARIELNEALLQLKKASEEAGTWETLAKEAESRATKAEASALEAESRATKAEASALEAESRAAAGEPQQKTIETPPNTPPLIKKPKLSQKILELRDEFKGQILIADSAIRDVDKNFGRNTRLGPIIEAMIKGLAQKLHPLYFPAKGAPKTSGGVFMNFNARSLYKISRESDTTMNDRYLSDQRTISYNGKTYVGESHMKYGNSPGNQVRIHFAVDKELQRIVITHIVDHLDVKSTN